MNVPTGLAAHPLHGQLGVGHFGWQAADNPHRKRL